MVNNLQLQPYVVVLLSGSKKSKITPVSPNGTEIMGCSKGSELI